jgi:type I restriction-modification system DNA methylase subunit
MTKEQAKESIAKLVDRFREHREQYHATDYNEAKTRQDFINPFFKALGWDIHNERGDSESYREVIYEDIVFVRGKAKAPDYGFRLQGSGKSRLFYVEAKKPSVKPALKLNRESAYQLRRYGSSAQAGVSILTNFEDFIIYDCSRVPNVDDSASVARLKHIHFEDYVTEFDFIYDTFSHEAVTKGRFDKFVQNDANKKGKDTLDKRFVQSLDEWRQYLAKSMATSNRKLDDEQLNFAVQLTIDRLIFLRFCEDRAVEPYGQLQKAVAKGDSYKNLFALFKLADDKYNSGLFDFEKDTLTPSLKVDNKVMKNIIDELYYPQCNFEFSVMPVEILGNAYEQFLGKVIRITPARSVKIEEKPEVRKAGGVYYTPQYIVEYIVKNTVGKLIEGKTPKEISAIKIVDPACGSGSFLLGAFDFLLSYHINWYHQNGFAAKKGKDNPFTPQGTLTTHEKKRILINNIFGVDIDANAVEVTKLSLLLKCMEGETEASIHQQMAMFHERVLPDLDNNIKDGNSLIDTDFYDSQIDYGYERKIKPFSWQKGFPQVFKPRKEDATRDFKKQFDLVKKQTKLAEEKAKQIFDNYSKVEEPEESYGVVGGFDAVIGNPPYGALFSDNELNYFKTKYKTSVWRGESYLLFVEQGLRMLRNEGLLGYIIPDTILNLGFTKSLREYLLQNSELKELINLPSTVFSGATVDTIILLTEKKDWVKLFHPSLIDVSVFSKKAIITSIKNPNRTFKVSASEWSDQGFFNVQSDSADHKLLQKIESNKKLVGDIASLYSGIKTYELGKGTPPQTIKIRDSKPYTSESKVSKEWSTFFDGKHIGRYVSHWQKDNWIKYGSWLAAPRDSENFEGEKILIRKITGKRIIASYIPITSYCNTLLFVLKLKSKYISYQSLLAVLNSSLIGWYFRKKFQINEDDTFPQIMIRDIEQFPIPEIDERYQSTLDKHVNLLLGLNLNLQSEKLPANSEQIKTRIAHSEEKIDQLVYELYQLTPEEIKIVEGGSDE